MHKEAQPFRPIVNRRGSPVFYLEQYINGFLKNLINDTNYKTKSSIELIEDLKQIKLNRTTRMLSLDVVSLYPSIPIHELTPIIEEKCRNHGILNHKVNFIMKSLQLINHANVFQVNKKFYRQLKGAPMGSVLAATLGELTMEYIENLIIPKRILKPLMYRRYVDDILVLWDYTDKSLDEFVKELNQVFQTINLTTEHETNRSIPFLDILIHRTQDNSEIWTEIFHKKTAPLCIVPANSYSYAKYIEAAIKPLIKRASTHSTYEISKQKELKEIKREMHNKGFTGQFITKMLKKYDKINPDHETKDKPDSKYIGAIQFNPMLMNLMKTMKNLGYKLAFRNEKLQSLIVKDRDKTTSTEGGGVYKIPIHTKNEERLYIGKTRNSLTKRIYQHKYSLKAPYGNTALKDFILNNDSKPDWRSAIILKRPGDDTALDLQERIEIWRNRKKCVNSIQNHDFISMWQPLLRQDSKVSADENDKI